MRPKTIVAFEVICLAVLVLAVVRMIWLWKEVIAISSPPYPALFAMAQILIVGTLLLLILLISRRRSNAAKWILIALFALFIPSVLAIWRTGPEPEPGWPTNFLTVAAVLGIGLGLLFTPSARAWLGAKAAPPTAEALQQTFE